jgi:hypothetical protein
MTKANHANTTSRAPDPIFAAIAAHKAAEQAYRDAILLTERLESELPEDMRQSDLPHIVETDDPRWIAAERTTQATSEEEEECGAALLDVRPTTLSGLLSLLRYADECGRGRDWPDRVVSAAAEALEALAPDEEADPRVSKFGGAYHEWFEALASEAKVNAGGYAGADDPDAVIDAAIDRVQAAEHQLTVLPAILPYQLVNKFEVLETMISKRERDGYPADGRHMLMLSSVKADLYRFRIGRRES